jgi:hypothetical protein
MKKRIWGYLGIAILGLIGIFIFMPPAINYPKGCIKEGQLILSGQGKCCFGLREWNECQSSSDSYMCKYGLNSSTCEKYMRR